MERAELEQRAFTWTEKLFVCTAFLLLTLVVVGTVNSIAHSEFYFSHPSLQERFRTLPAVSQFFFMYYPFAWIIVLVVGLWSLRILMRTKTRLAEVAVFAAYALLCIVSYAMLAGFALYASNQTFVFRFQHLN